MKDEDKDKTARDFTKNRDESIRAASWWQDGLWVIVLANGGRNFCTYVGLPIFHPLAGQDYDNLIIDCHGGLTYAGEGDGKYRPEGYYWYGWDYGHSGDYSYWGRDDEQPRADERDWTLGDVKDDAWSAIWDMSKLKKLAESIANKSAQSN